MDGNSKQLENRNPQESDTFSLQFNKHMLRGTRPAGNTQSPGDEWGEKELADRLGVDKKTIRNWQNGTLPQEIRSIEREFFGKNPEYDPWRIYLRTSHQAELRARRGNIRDPAVDSLAQSNGEPFRQSRTDNRVDEQPAAPPKSGTDGLDAGQSEENIHPAGSKFRDHLIYEFIGLEEFKRFLKGHHSIIGALAPITGAVGAFFTFGHKIASVVGIIFGLAAFAMLGASIFHAAQRKIYVKYCIQFIVLTTVCVIAVMFLKTSAFDANPASPNVQIIENEPVKDQRSPSVTIRTGKSSDLGGSPSQIEINLIIDHQISETIKSAESVSGDAAKKYEDVFKSLNEKNLPKALDELKKIAAVDELDLENKRHDVLVNYKLLGSLVYFSDKAASQAYFQKALEIDPNDEDVQFVVALFQFQEGSFRDAANELKSISEHTVTIEYRAYADFMLKTIEAMSTANFTEYVAYLQDRIKIFKEMADKDTGAIGWSSILTAVTASPINDYYYMVGRLDEASAACENGIAAVNSLVESTPENGLPGIYYIRAILQADLVKITIANGRLQEAEEKYRDAAGSLAELRKYGSSSKSALEIDSRLKEIEGSLFAAEGRPDAAAASFQNAVNDIAALNTNSQSNWLLAMNLEVAFADAGDAFLTLSLNDKAVESYRKALGVITAVDGVGEAIKSEERARLQERIGRTLYEMDDFQGAKSILQEALTGLANFIDARSPPDIVKILELGIKIDLLKIADDEDDEDVKRELYKSLIEIAKELLSNESYGSQVKTNLWAFYTNYGHLLMQNISQLPEAKQQFEDALVLVQPDNQPLSQFRAAQTQVDIADVLREQTDPDWPQLIVKYKSSISIEEGISDIAEPARENAVAIAYSRLATAFEEMKPSRDEDALEAYRKGLAAIQRALKLDAENEDILEKVIFFHNAIAAIFEEKNLGDKAADEFKLGVDAVNPFSKENVTSDLLRSRLLYSYKRMGFLHLAQERFANALNDWKMERTIQEARLEANQGDREILEGVAGSNDRVGIAATALMKSDPTLQNEAVSALTRSEKIWSDLTREYETEDDPYRFNVMQEQSVSFYIFGNALSVEGKQPEALQKYKSEFSLLEKIVSENPDGEDNERSLSEALGHVTAALERIDDRAATIEFLRTALASTSGILCDGRPKTLWLSSVVAGIEKSLIDLGDGLTERWPEFAALLEEMKPLGDLTKAAQAELEIAKEKSASAPHRSFCIKG